MSRTAQLDRLVQAERRSGWYWRLGCWWLTRRWLRWHVDGRYDLHGGHRHDHAGREVRWL